MFNNLTELVDSLLLEKKGLQIIEENVMEKIDEFSIILQEKEVYKEVPEGIKKIFTVSWNSLVETKINNEFYYIMFILFKKNLISLKILKEIFKHLQNGEKLQHEHIIVAFIIHTYKQQKEENNEIIIDYFKYLDFCREIGVKPHLFSSFCNYLDKLKIQLEINQESVSTAEKLEKTINLLQKKSIYINEFIPSFPTETLEFLDLFIDYEILAELDLKFSEYLASKLSINKKVTIPDFQVKVEKLLEKHNYPYIPVTFHPFFEKHKEKIEARTVKIDELAKVPSPLVREFAAKKAYSCHKLAQKVRISFLGGGGIGNMAILIQHNNDAILIDYGMSVSNYSIPRWHPSLRSVKAVLVTHAHLDHIGALPYLFNSDREKRWYGSTNTKILGEKLLFNTSSMLQEIEESKMPSPFLRAIRNESTLIDFFNRFNSLKPNETIEISPEFYVTPLSSSHVFGSYGYLIEIFEKKIFFTGDFKLEQSNLFKGANYPTKSDVTIFDGTYYNRNQQKIDNETTILNAVNNNQRIIVPAFSVGRAQEMYKLFEKLRLTKDWKIKIVGLAGEITKLMGISGDHTLLKTMSADEFNEGDIVIAGNGMLQGGTSRLLLEETKQDENVGVIICGYQAPETLGYALKINHPVALNEFSQQVYNVHISGHTSSKNLDNFISKLEGKKIMVHTPENVQIKHKDVMIPKYRETFNLKI